MEAGLGPTAAAWGQLSGLGAPGNTGLDFSLRNGNGQIDLDSRHWGPIVFPCQEGSSAQDSQQKESNGSRMGQLATNPADQSLQKTGSDALMSSSSASSSAQPQFIQQDAGRSGGGQCESSGQGMAEFAGEGLQQQFNLGPGQQQQQHRRRSSDSFASLPRIHSSERLDPEHRSGSGTRLPALSSQERLDQLAAASLQGRHPSSSDMSMEGGSQRRLDSSPSFHRRMTSSGTEDDIFSAVGGLEIDAEHRNSSFGHGLDSLPRVSSRGQIEGQHEREKERETRTLVVKNVNPAVDDADFKQLFEKYGDLRTLYTACKEQGWLMISYFNIIAAKLAKINLDGQVIHERRCEIRFGPNKEAKEFSEGMVTMLNRNPTLSDQEIVRILSSEFGDIYTIFTPAENPSRRCIEFCDVRHATAAKQVLEGIAAKIPTISEQGTAAVEMPGGLRNVQSTHTFFPQAGPAGPPPPPQEMRPHSWDNSGAQISNMAAVAQSQLLQQLNNPQLLASLSSQSLYNQQAPMGMNGSNEASSSLQADVDSLMRGNLFDASQGSNSAIQALLNQRSGSSNSLSSMQSAQSHQNLAGMHHGRGLGPNSSMQRSSSNLALDSTADLLSAGSQHLSASQLLALEAAAANSQGQSGGHQGMDQGGGFPRRSASMSTGNLADLCQQGSLDGLMGGGLQGAGLRGVASTSQIWDGQGDNTNWSQAALQAQAQALAQLQLQLAGGLDPNAAAFLPTSPRNALGAFAQQQLVQQHLQSLSLQQSTAALLAQAGALRSLSLGGVAGHNLRGGGKGGRDDTGGGRLCRRVLDPAAEAERKAAQEKLYSLDMNKVMKGDDKRTTLMIKNIPNKYTQKMLLATIDEHFKGNYDFFYLPIDFKNKCNVGYAFINMILPEYIPALYERFHAKKWEKFNSEKVCHISYARIQGKSSLITHFQNSSLLHEDKRCRPILFRSDGKTAGEQEPFPVGPNVRSRAARPGSAGSAGLGSLPVSHSSGQGGSTAPRSPAHY